MTPKMRYCFKGVTIIHNTAEKNNASNQKNALEKKRKINLKCMTLKRIYRL